MIPRKRGGWVFPGHICVTRCFSFLPFCRFSLLISALALLFQDPTFKSALSPESHS